MHQTTLYYLNNWNSTVNCSYSLIIWAFDGIHRGHYALFDQAYNYQNPIAVLTFDPSPKAYFSNTPVFQSIEIKNKIFAHRWVSLVYNIHFDNQIATLSAKSFIEQYLNYMSIAKIIVWQDFHFWYKQSGDIKTLQDLFDCDIIYRTQPKISSSYIQKNITHHAHQLVQIDDIQDNIRLQKFKQNIWIL